MKRFNAENLIGTLIDVFEDTLMNKDEKRKGIAYAVYKELGLLKVEDLPFRRKR